MKGKHGYQGNCAPGSGGEWNGQETFSLGIFEMVTATTTASGWKKGKIKVRVSGHMHDAEKVYLRAKEIVDALDAGIYDGKKNVRV